MEKKATELTFGKVFEIRKELRLERDRIYERLQQSGEHWANQDELGCCGDDTLGTWEKSVRDGRRLDTVARMIDEMAQIEGKINASDKLLNFLVDAERTE